MVTRLYVGCCLLLFFAMAWLRADRTLAATVKYRLPLGVRARFTAIRLYWLVDAFLSGLVALAYSPLAGLPGKLFETTLLGGVDLDSSVSQLSYPLAAVVLGYCWPQISAFTVTVGRGSETAFRASLSQLRDHLLGGSALGPINARLHLAITSYVDRVVEAAMRPGEPSGPDILRAVMLCGPGKARPAALGAHRRFAASPPDPQVRRDRAELRAEVLARAEQDCAGVYAAVSAVKMIPFVERSRPLMMVPDMTVHEEEKLYRAGITTVARLARGEPRGAGGLSPERLAELRLGARRLVARRLWFGFGLAGIAGAVLFLGSMSLGLYGVEPTPPDGPHFRLEPASVRSSNEGPRP